MDAKELIRTVARRSGLSRAEAADLTRATLATLADRLSAGEARHLALRVPEPLGESLGARTGSAQKFGLDEFVRRVSAHTGLTVREATDGVRAVLATLREALGDEQFDHVMAQLPGEVRELAELG
ncbi:DUF2267 domain-containing protein [Actinophytocola sp.]|uniref:DUF2267 domain-containing protein n=1 Tax=Actinophytocola sp. TaxID=1872138 RepID=UPI002ED9B203